MTPPWLLLVEPDGVRRQAMRSWLAGHPCRVEAVADWPALLPASAPPTLLVAPAPPPVGSPWRELVLPLLLPVAAGEECPVGREHWHALLPTPPAPLPLQHAVGLLLALAHREREAQLAQATLDAVLRHTEEAVVVVDAGLVVRQINESARQVCPHGSHGLVGHPFTALPSDCAGLLSKLLHQAMGEGLPQEEVELTCPDSQRGNLEVRATVSPLRVAGETAGALLLVRDRTRLTLMENAREQRGRYQRMIGNSPPMRELFALIEDLAGYDATTLITGESGTGKELVAEALHYQGARAGRPLIKVNCAGLPETLLESELFGHVKGAFTGAIKDRMGRFQMADTGTLFLDEIGDISLNMQSRLLRVLEESEFERVGDSRTLKVDVRIVAATNANLRDKVARGLFREDLYYRLNVVELHIPPLRERLEDIPLLTEHFLHKFNAKYGKSLRGLAEPVTELFLGYSWPGNVRELEHVIEHAFVTCRQGAVKVKHLPRGLVRLPEGIKAAPLVKAPVKVPEEDNERAAIMRALEAVHWRKNKAADLLGMSRSSLYRKIEKYRIKA